MIQIFRKYRVSAQQQTVDKQTDPSPVLMTDRNAFDLPDVDGNDGGDNSNSNDGSLMKYYEGERVSRWFVCTQRAIMLLGAAGGESFLSGVVTVV